MQTLRLLFRYAPIKIIALAAALVVAPRLANAEALLLVEADTGKVLEAQ
ncbi:MAG: peptidase M15, partial [Bradyrhizobium sp.]|nr:peptidase M15 [Bradyrhizobium sp.]